MALRMVGPIFGGMMIFYAFFTGMSTGQSILREEEEGTLPRLFTTPTTQTEILVGKFLAIGLTVLVQVVVLITLSRFIFGIEWGEPLAVVLFALGTIISASAFGVMVNSFLKNTKQAGVVMGGLLTVTGMVGMMDIFTGNAGGNQFGILPLFTPQGWAARSMFNASLGASALDILPNILALLAFSFIFFVIGVLRFQKRYA
jgi:ABC-2 type transport system permease protein